MKKYKFSAPMPYTIEYINKILKINKQVEKSKITSLYFGLPFSNELFTGFEQYRNYDINDYNFDYWKKLIIHSMEKGADFIYLLNRSNLYYENFDKLYIQLEKLDRLLNEFRKIGVKKLRVADHKLLTYLNKNYTDFTLLASTSFEYKLINEYKNFMLLHPYIKQIVPSHDCIKNFLLLQNLVKLFPDTEIELIVNQGCLNGCPMRNNHQSFCKNDLTNDNIFANSYYLQHCNNIQNGNLANKIININIIYPWEIAEYSKIGIINFKFTGRDTFLFDVDWLINSYLQYLKGIDNYKLISEIPVNAIIERLQGFDALDIINMGDIKKYLPDVKHFKKYGHLCSTRCQAECKYCNKCKDKLKKVIEKKQIKEIQKEISFCKIK